MRFIKNSLTFLLIISCLFCCASTLKQIKTSGFTPSNTLFLAGAFGSSDYHGNTNSKEADLRQQASQGFDTAGSIYHNSGIYVPPVSEAVPVYDEAYELQRQKQREQEERRLAEERKRIEEEQRRLEEERQRREEERRRQEELERQRQEEQRLWEEQQQRQREEERRLEEERQRELQRQLEQEQQRLLELENKRKECGNGYMHQSSYNCQECCTALNAPHYEYNTQDYEEPVCTCNW